jgi:hypothetical protein
MISSYVKAVVVRSRKLLVLVKEDDEGIRYVLPGGRQEDRKKGRRCPLHYTVNAGRK